MGSAGGHGEGGGSGVSREAGGGWGQWDKQGKGRASGVGREAGEG